MKAVYISNRGDDQNPGTIYKPVYSWKRAKELQGSNNENIMRFLDKACAISVKKRPKGNSAARPISRQGGRAWSLDRARP